MKIQQSQYYCTLARPLTVTELNTLERPLNWASAASSLPIVESYQLLGVVPGSRKRSHWTKVKCCSSFQSL